MSEPKPLRVALIHPGADWATFDTYEGIYKALERKGVEVVAYNLSGRIQASGGYFKWWWNHQKRQGYDLPKYTEADILFDACQHILTRALYFGVDWVVLISGTYIPPQVLGMIRRAGLKICTILTESPYQEIQEITLARYSDVVFTNERTAIPTFAPHCRMRCYYWQHALDPEKHHPDTQDGDVEGLEDVAAHDVVFVGTGWEERCDLLEAVNWDGIDFGLYGSWALLGSRNKLRQHIRAGIIDNHLTAALYRKAKIGINLHRTSITWGRGVDHIERAESMNPRCYELAADGCFFLTDYRAEVGEVFGDAVPTFDTPQELEQWIRYYLAHDAERREMAAKLPGLVAEHTFDNRIPKLMDVLTNYTT
jgi:spore maturation protein CgeB